MLNNENIPKGYLKGKKSKLSVLGALNDSRFLRGEWAVRNLQIDTSSITCVHPEMGYFKILRKL